MISSNPSVFDSKSGANPPSSPTPVESPLSFNTFFKLWNTSAPTRTLSFMVSLIGIIINSWKSSLLSAWAPPLIIFIIGLGSVVPSPIYLYNGIFLDSAAAFSVAIEIPNIALAPYLDFVFVPSACIIA